MKIDYADDFHSVAWFPYHPRGEPIPYSSFTEYIEQRPTAAAKIKHWIAFKELFASGNHPEPPPVWQDHAGFLDHLKTSEYRAAFFIRNIKVFRNALGLVDATFEEVLDDSYVGFTPLRLNRPLRILCHYSPGRGRNTAVAKLPGPDSVVLQQKISFMLGRWTNVVNRLLTTFWAPYAWMQVRYELFEDRPAECRVIGSILPNQSYYRQWWQRHAYTIGSVDKNDVAGFLRAGAGNDAPSWNGSEVSL